jgi:transcriptional regulator with XRE-family HTH domain
VIIGERLRFFREQKGLTQGEIEKRTGLLRCYLSRVENGHTVPAVNTLEKWARALDVPLYRLFYGKQDAAELEDTPEGKAAGIKARETARLFAKFRRLFPHVRENDRQLLLTMAQTMANQEHGAKPKTALKNGRKQRRQAS